MTAEPHYDVAIVGGGLIGLGVAAALSERLDGVSLLVLEKEDEVAQHQSSHNSGVIHSGLYYRPGSLKAKLCVEGRRAIEELATEGTIPARQSGKLVVATDASELPALDELERRGKANGLIGLERLGPAGISELEPEAAGVEALFVPEAGVTDFVALANHLVGRLACAGSEIVKSAEVTAIGHSPDRVEVATSVGSFSCRVLVNCAGLHSDRVAAMAGVDLPIRIVPFRGEYYRLGEAAPLVRALIYPVPDPRFPFLGVHFTRRIDGTVEVGPNAVLAIGREHYAGAKPDWSELRAVLGYQGFRRLAMNYWSAGLSEMLDSWSRTRYAGVARRLIPGIRKADLLPGGVGVRAQAVDRLGSLVDDFVIQATSNTIHVLNAPSPGATASIAIGRHVAERVTSLFFT